MKEVIFFSNLRAIEELKTKPKVLMLENVKNLTGHDKGKTARVIVNSLRELGYSVFWNIFNTSVHTDIPQNRERTFIICFKDEVIGSLVINYPVVKNLVSNYLFQRVRKKRILENF